VIDAVLAGKDCLAVMPTGEESLLLFIPELLQQGVTLVVSPLNALIVDQMNYLSNLE
jgi:bloom syndrome protein